MGELSSDNISHNAFIIIITEDQTPYILSRPHKMFFGKIILGTFFEKSLTFLQKNNFDLISVSFLIFFEGLLVLLRHTVPVTFHFLTVEYYPTPRCQTSSTKRKVSFKR
jgi:hypothetical protein